MSFGSSRFNAVDVVLVLVVGVRTADVFHKQEAARILHNFLIGRVIARGSVCRTLSSGCAGHRFSFCGDTQ